MPISNVEFTYLAHDGIVQLFILDLTPIGVNQVLRFSNVQMPGGSLSIVFGGLTYTNLPIEAEGFEYNGRGQLPTPTLRVSNVLSAFSPLVVQYGDLLGAKLTRIRTFAKHLDGGPAADPTAFTQPDIYFLERKVAENKLVIEWELRSALDLTNIKLPSRLVLANLCGWRYRSAECSYTGGPVATENDIPTTNPLLDECGRRLRSCELRFGANNPLPYGGFPGVDNQRFG